MYGEQGFAEGARREGGVAAESARLVGRDRPQRAESSGSFGSALSCLLQRSMFYGDTGYVVYIPYTIIHIYSCAHVTTLLCPHHHTLLYPHPNTHTHLRLYRIRKIALSTLMSARITSGLASNFSRSGVHTSLRSSGFWSAMNLYIGVCFMNYVTIPHSRPRSSRCRDDGR